MSRATIAGYPVDVLSVGALSLVVMVPMLVFGDKIAFLQNATLAAVLTLAVNYPHFMASYALVYRSPEQILRYRRATIVVPGIMFAYIAFALAMANETSLYFHLMFIVGGLYIGVHYVGQTWGMIAAYSNLENDRFTDNERRWVRTSLYVLVLWHATSFAQAAAQPPPELVPLLARLHLAVGWLVPLGFFASAYGMLKYTRRLGHMPATRVWLPWISIFVWYAVFAGHPAGAFWVQIAHSVQYLIFPARMEVNRAARRENGRDLPAAVRLALWYGVLFAAGYVVFKLSPTLLTMPLKGVEGAEEMIGLMPLAVTVFVNVHHYYTDGCIWKLRDPEVRADLFFHLKSAKASSA